VDNDLRGSDQRFSLNPAKMAELVQGIAAVRQALGSGIKRRFDSENAALRKLSKKIVAARDLPAGHVLARADLTVRSPGDGMSPHLLDHVLGQRLRHELRRDDDISTAAIEPPSPQP